MHFLRFGSSIPGDYWGCCACDIIQNFHKDPDEKASIQLVDGDGASAILNEKGEGLFAGPTYRDIFHQRLRIGTFYNTDMPNHGFIAIITQEQINGYVGQKWLSILREAGFEFIRSIANSVYEGDEVGDEDDFDEGGSLNYVFALFRNIGQGAPADPFTPPAAWTALPKVVPETRDFIGAEINDVCKEQRDSHRAIWDKIGPAKLMTEAEVEAAGVVVTLAGKRSENPQEPKKTREARKADKVRLAAAALAKFAPVAAPSVFPVVASSMVKLTSGN